MINNQIIRGRKNMHFKTEHILIVLLLLPFGLRALLPAPMVDILIILGLLAAIPMLLVYIYERKKPAKIGKLAITSRMLTKDEVEQILFCQKHCDEKFGEIAVRRHFIKVSDLDALLVMQKI
jgi:hypothetical protein